MKKRILSMLLTVAMIFSMLPSVAVPALAASTHENEESCFEEGATSVEFTSVTTELNGDYSYYLTENVTLTQNVAVQPVDEYTQVTLCLNGNTLTLGNYGFDDPGMVFIKDCTNTLSADYTVDGNVAFTITWIDGSDAAGARPEVNEHSFKINATSPWDSNTVVKTVTPSFDVNGDTWTATCNVPVFANHEDYGFGLCQYELICDNLPDDYSIDSSADPDGTAWTVQRTAEGANIILESLFEETDSFFEYTGDKTLILTVKQGDCVFGEYNVTPNDYGTYGTVYGDDEGVAVDFPVYVKTDGTYTPEYTATAAFKDDTTKSSYIPVLKFKSATLNDDWPHVVFTYTIDVQPAYSITVETSEHGQISANSEYAGAGDAITLTATPDVGYALSSVTVKQGEDNISLSDTADANVKTFTMPSGNVTVTAVFASEHSHPVCGVSCGDHDLDGTDDNHEAVSYTALSEVLSYDSATDTYSGALSEGSYYLDKDITLSSTLSISASVNLCLNGFTLSLDSEATSGSAIYLTGGQFALCDCSSSDTGKITGGRGNGTGSRTYGGGVYVRSSSTFDMYGGTICDNYAYLGGGVYLDSSARMTMYGGAVTNNDCSAVYGHGIAASAGGYVTVYNATVSNNGSNGKDIVINKLDGLTIAGSPVIGRVFSTGSGTTYGQITVAGELTKPSTPITIEFLNGPSVSNNTIVPQYYVKWNSSAGDVPSDISEYFSYVKYPSTGAEKYKKVSVSDGSATLFGLSLYAVAVKDYYSNVDAVSTDPNVGAEEEASVAVTATPVDGYVVTSVKAVYTDADNVDQTISATKQTDGTWKFTMPAADVEIEVETAYEVTAGIVTMDDMTDNYIGDAFNVYLYDDGGELVEEKQVDSSNNWKATFTVPLTYTDEDDEEQDVNIEDYTIKIDKLNGYTATLSPYLSGDEAAAVGGYNFAILLNEVQNVELTVSGTSHVSDGERKSISIDGVSPEELSADDFTIKYYAIDENEGVLTELSQEPLAVGKYVYVISFADYTGEENPYIGYAFENEYLNPEDYDSQYYPIDSEQDIPSDTVIYSNAGIMEIKAKAETLGSISFNDGLVNKYLDEEEYYQEFDADIEFDGEVTYKWTSSNGNVATVDDDGEVTFMGEGTTTIKVVASGDESVAPISATYVLVVSKRPVTVTMADTEVTYGDDTPENLAYTASADDHTVDTNSLTVTPSTTYASGSKVGTYPITATVSSDLYNVTVVPGTLTVDPKELTADDFNVTAADKTYDGKTDATVSASVNSSSLVNSGDQVTVLVSGNFENADAGTNKTVDYTITGLSGADAGNYKIKDSTITGTTTATIEKATVSVQADSNSSFYDGNEKSLTAWALVNGSFFTDFTKSYSYTDASGNPQTTESPIDVGTYTLVLTMTDDAAQNYAFGSYSATLTIIAADGNFMALKPDAPIYYGDTDHKVEVKGDDGYTLKYEVTEGTEIVSVDNDGKLTFTGVGEVTVNVTGTKANYKEETDEVSFTVLPRPVSASVTMSNREYDGTADMSDEVVSITLTDYAGDTVTEVEATVSSASISNSSVGAHTATVVLKLTGDKADCYTLTSKNVYVPVTISKKEVTISITAQDKVYDGTTTAEVTVTLDGVIESEKNSVYAVGSAAFEDANAGNDKTVTYAAQGLLGDKSGNYVLTSNTETATANITKRPVKFTFGTLDFVYDGSAKTVVISAATDDGKVFSDYTVTYDGDLTDGKAIYAGEYPITITINDTNYKLADDYAAKTMTITKRDQADMMIINVPSEKPQYDTTFQLGIFGGNGTGKVVWSSSDESIATVGENGTVTVTGVGTVVITATKQADGGYNETSATATITTTQREVSFQISGLEHTFDGTAKSVTVTPTVNGATYEVTYTGEKETIGQAINAGTYTVTVTATGNYTGSATATMVINKADLDVTGFAVADTSYGTDPDVTYPSNIPTGVSYQLIYIVDGAESEKSPKNASEAEYTAKLILSGDNYNTKTLEDTFKIGKATLTATAKDAKRAYGQNNPDFEISYSGFKYEETEDVLNVKPIASTTASPESATGTYDITVSGGTDDNYIFEYVKGTLTITAADESGTQYLPDQNGDGQPEADPDGDGIYEDEDGNKYIPDQDGDGEPEKVTDEDGDGIHKDEDGNQYIPDQDGDGEVETDEDDDGIFEGSDEDKGETYIPVDPDGDGENEFAADDDDDGIYEDDEGNTYIPDQDGDGEAEADTDGDGIFEGSDEDKGETYIPVDTDDDGENDEFATDDDGDGIYEDDEGNKYIPEDSDGDGVIDGGTKIEDNDGDGIYEDEDGNEYIPDQDGDGEAEKVTDTDDDGIYEDEDGNQYLPDEDGDGEVETDEDGDGIFEGSDEDKGETYIPVDTDGDGENDDIATDDDGDGIYEDEDGNEYAPDENGKYRPYVAAPVVTPNGGTLYSSQSVSITTATEDATIYYTTDGTVPSETNGTEYTGAITISDTTTIRAVAVKNGVVSEVTSATFTKWSYYPPSTSTNYDITVNPSTNGDVTASRSYASAGTTITLTIDPDDGYKLNTLTVTDRYGNEVTVTDKSSNIYTFRMPSKDVWVTATFTKTSGTPGATEDCPRDYTCPMYPYSDLNRNLWYHDGVHYCIEHGLMGSTSTSELTFDPNLTTTRAMIVTILWRLEGCPEVDYDMTFADVADGLWYTKAIRWAQSTGVVEGYSEEKFGPADTITREQMATIMWRYAKYKGYDVSVGENTNILSYGDAFDVAEWAIPAMQWACGTGLIQGIADGTTMNLQPQGNATRAQAATILYRFCEKIVTE